MDANKAIKTLKHHYEWLRQSWKPYPDQKVLDAIGMAVSALEKQIAKKPYIQQDNRNNDCMECPSCDSFIGYECDCRDEHYQINYFPNCGQAIDCSENSEA